MILMNNFESYLVELLQGYLFFDGSSVEVRKNFLPLAVLPCVTLDLGAGTTTDYYWHDLDDDGHEIVWQHCTSDINLNVWCNTEQERESLTAQIQECFHKEKLYHYSYCSQYDDGNCSSGGRCGVNTSGSAKQVCPDPYLYGYESLRAKHGIVDNSVRVEPPFDMDEFDRKPPLLRSVLRCSGEYERIVDCAGVPFDDIVIEGFDADVVD